MRYTDYKYDIPEEKIVRVILDTDAKNEADDQFAIVHCLLTPRFENVGFVAAHFGTRADDTMEQSYKEIELIFDKMGFPKEGNIFHGGKNALPDMVTPVDSEGARLIVREANKNDPRPLYVLFLGPLTDMASALLIDPSIAAKNVHVIWIGGEAYPNGGKEFNLSNDIYAANVVFQSKIDVWQIPRPTYKLVPISLAEMELKISECGAIGEYLLYQLDTHAHEPIARRPGARTGDTWSIGDNPAIGVLLYDNVYDYDYVRAPYITQEMMYLQTNTNRPIRVYNKVDSRLIADDLFAKLALFSKKHPEGLNNQTDLLSCDH